MAHELASHTLIDSITGETTKKVSMAYVGETPWHKLGQQLTQNAPFEVWLTEAGMDFTVLSAPVTFVHDRKVHKFANRNVLFRSDNSKELSIVSDNYKILQPSQILQSQFDICSQLGAEMHTAGVLFDGRRFWSLSKLDNEFTLNGKDTIGKYILIATSVDGTLATTVRYTSVRVVCNNTLTMAVDNRTCEYKVNHNSIFSLDSAKQALMLDDTTFDDQAKEMSKTRLSDDDAVKYFSKVLKKGREQQAAVEEFVFETRQNQHSDIMDALLSGEMTGTQDEKQVEELLEDVNGKHMQKIHELYSGAGMGSQYASANGTLWGAVNAVSEFYDHHRGSRSADNRLNRAWFGDGENTKNKAWSSAVDMIS